ncbi:MAG: SigE family polymerase sigma factor [Ilumatobacteraceae bacterium]|nr:SigE family polymerase sigma factor [Ilumatobacteraceae bacterium]
MRTESVDRSAIFTDFVERTEPRLRRALVAAYGPTIGREAAVDALSWAWEHWDRLDGMDNPAGYLYRVGQSAASRLLKSASTAMSDPPATAAANDPAGALTDVRPYLEQLSEQQRAAVMLVHGYGISQRETAEVLGLSVSTLREHLRRGMERLRMSMEHER